MSMSLGIWMTLLTYLISIPLGISKAVDDGSQFDVWTSGVIIVGYAIPGFLFAILLIVLFAGGSFFDWFPLRGLISENWAQLPWWQKIGDYFWHLTLPIISMALSAFATMTLLTKNSFLDEIRKQYVLTARAKGCTRNAGAVRPRLPQRHADRHRRLPRRLRARLLHRLAADRNHLLARRPRPARLRERAQPRLSGGVRHALHLLAHRPGGEPAVRSRPTPGSIRASISRRGRSDGGRALARYHGGRHMPVWTCRRSGAGSASRRSTGGAGKISRPTGAATGRCGCFSLLFILSLFAEFIANDKPIFIDVNGKSFFPAVVTYPDTAFAKTPTRCCSAPPPTTATII